MLTWAKISHWFYTSCRLLWLKCAKWVPFEEAEKGKDLQVFCLMCVNQAWNKWHKCSLLWDKLDLAEDLALFIHEAINKAQARQHTCRAEPQEGCFARCWAGWVGQGKHAALGSLGGDVLLSRPQQLWWEGERLPPPLCAVWSSVIFQDHNSRRRKNLMNKMRVRGDARGSRAQCAAAQNSVIFLSLTELLAVRKLNL